MMRGARHEGRLEQGETRSGWGQQRPGITDSKTQEKNEGRCCKASGRGLQRLLAGSRGVVGTQEQGQHGWRQ